MPGQVIWFYTMIQSDKNDAKENKSFRSIMKPQADRKYSMYSNTSCHGIPITLWLSSPGCV